MIKKLLPLFIALVLSLSSCTKEMIIDVPLDDEMPVMNSIVSADSIIYVNLSWSKPITQSDNGFEDITNAGVSLFVNDIFIESLNGKRFGAGFYYYSTHKAASGQKMNLVVDLDNSVSLSSETVVPAKPQLIPGSTVPVSQDAFGYNEYRFNFTVIDPADANNYYQLRIIPVTNNKENDYENPVYFTIENFKSGKGGIFDDFIDQEQRNTHYFSDETFNGQNFLLLIKAKTQMQLNTVKVELSSITKDTYLYYTSILLQRARNNDPFYEKVKIHSNIQNGLGIMGSEAGNSFVVELQ